MSKVSSAPAIIEPSGSQTRLMIVDDQLPIIMGLKAWIEEQSIARVVATETEGNAAIESAMLHRPDVILLDVSIPDMNGIQIARKLIKLWPEVVILAISAHSNEVYVRSMVDTGVRGYVLKDHVPTELKEALQSVLRGDIWIGRDLEYRT